MSYLSYTDDATQAPLKMASSTTGRSSKQRLLEASAMGRLHTEHFDTIMKGSAAITALGIAPRLVWVRFKDGLIEYAPRVGVIPIFVDENGDPICHKYSNDDLGRESCIKRIMAFVDAIEAGDTDLLNAIEAAVQRRTVKLRSSKAKSPAARKIAVYYKEG
jgi:hypothetical protein